MAHFSKANSIVISSHYILTSCINVSNSFSFLVNNLMSSIYVRYFFFCCCFFFLRCKFLTACAFLSSIIAITNSYGENVSPWKISLWIFSSAEIVPPAVHSTLEFYIVSVFNLIALSLIVYIFREYLMQLSRTILYLFLKSIQTKNTFFVSFCCL